MKDRTDVVKYDLDKETFFTWMVDYEVRNLGTRFPIIEQL